MDGSAGSEERTLFRKQIEQLSIALAEAQDGSREYSQKLFALTERVRSFLIGMGMRADSIIDIPEVGADAEDLVQILTTLIKSLLHDKECKVREMLRLERSLKTAGQREKDLRFNITRKERAIKGLELRVEGLEGDINSRKKRKRKRRRNR